MSQLRALLRSPVPWLCLLAPLVVGSLARSGALEPVETLDTLSYEVLREFGFHDVLTSVRTYGYSAFLTLYDTLFADGLLTPHSRVPELHLAFYWAAVLLFGAGLATYLGSTGRALAATLPFANACGLALLPAVESDFLALALAIATLGSLLMVAARPGNRWWWLALGAATFATYFTRPAYLFLLGLVPVAGWLLRLADEPRVRRRHLQHLAVLAAVVWLPYLAYCGLRRAVVGEFTLVSFTGYQLIGVGATFLDDELVAELPPQERPFARRILELRQARGWTPLPASGPVWPWFHQESDNIFEIAEPVIRTALMKERDSPDDRAVAARWRLSRHDVEVPPLCGEIVLATNQRMLQLAKAILERRPGQWLRWIRGGVAFGLAKLDDCFWIRWLSVALLASLPVAAIRLTVARRRPRPAAWWSPEGRRFLALALTCVGFYLLKLTLVSVAHWPLTRFSLAMHLFLPSVLALALFETWRVILRPAPAVT